MAKTDNKILARQKRIKRIRKKIFGTKECPRLRVFRSLKHIYAQIIDDENRVTLAHMSTVNPEFRKAMPKGKKEQSFEIGKQIAVQAKEKGIAKVVFDRGGYLYHGRVKALSEGAREGGLTF